LIRDYTRRIARSQVVGLMNAQFAIQRRRDLRAGEPARVAAVPRAVEGDRRSARKVAARVMMAAPGATGDHYLGCPASL
jgi:hypothetical protein